MLEYLIVVAIGVFGTGIYFYNLKKKCTSAQYRVSKMLDLPEFDELIVDFEEDEIQAKISKMND